MNRVLLFVPLILFLALVGYFAVGLTRNPNEIKSVLIDKPLPAIDLPVPDRQDVRFQTATLSGKVSLLNVFASWCIACRVEHPVLLKLTAAKEIPVYGLAWKDKPEELRAWLAELGDPYELIGDDARGRTAIDLGVTGAPETFVIDRQGRIRYKHIGPIDDHVWEKKLKPMIATIEAEP
jgi:cytochrome c biogenesis protein CcmG, thiol:disulfide interchange protein DsbE